MPEILSKLLNQVREFWSNLEKSQKKRIYITSAIITAAVTVGLILLTRPNYVTLISNIDQKQAGEMAGILNENNIWNKVENNGTSIVIKMKDNDNAQIALAQKGYPKGGMTFEDAIKMIGIGTTESDKKHIWKQQKMSDLASKIMMLDSIEEATVSIALPERTIFITPGQEQPRPTAYVMVKPKNQLTRQQVEGIVMIVSRSVENLDPKDVTVVDNNSIILNRDDGDELMGIVSSQEEMRMKKAAELQNRVYNYFSVDKFDNFDTIRVVANPYLDFDREKSQTKSVKNPDGMDNGALISSEKLKEKLENGTAGGVPGIDTNPGDANSPSYQIDSGENSSYSKQHDISNYQYDETLKEQEKATGILIPEKSTMAISIWYGKRVTDDSRISDEFIEQVKVAASTATGIPVSNISANKLKLAPPEIVEKTTAEIIREFISDYGLFILVLFMIIALLIAVIPRRSDESDIDEMIPATAGGPRFVVPETHAEIIPEIDFEEKSEIKKQIENFVKQKPESVAQLLRNWLSDEWDM